MARYPVGKPYVFKTKINIVGDYKGDEKKRLEKQLEKQLDDSLIISREMKKALRFIPYSQKIYHEYDTGAINRTINFFKYAYVANGYFRGGTTTYQLDTLNEKTGRLELTLTARPHKNHKIDTVIYDIQDSSLQQMALMEKGKSVIKKGDLYSQELLNAERNRLTNLYRNNGYFKINRENFKVVADTINRSLFVFTTDPFEQARLLDDATRFDANPSTSVTFTLNTPTDSSRLKQYYVGNVYVYPDNTDKDTEPPNRRRVNNYVTKIYYNNKYRNRVFPPHIFLKKGQLYRQADYDKTFNAFNYLGAWQQVNIIPRDSTRADTVDFSIYMLPYRKYQGERKLEGSINQNNSATSTQSSNLWGINASQSVKNRNMARQAIQTNFEARAGVEFRGKSRITDINTKESFINSGEFSLSYEMLFPKFIPGLIFPKYIPFLGKDFEARTTAPKSLLSVNAKYTERFQFFKLTEANLGLSYQGKSRKDVNWSFTWLNFERKFLKPTDSLQNQIDSFPILAFIFNDGMILGQKLNISRIIPGRKSNMTGSIRLSIENSGLFYSLFQLKEFNNNLFNFFKVEADRRWNIELGKKSLAFRTYLGLGVPYKQNIHLPFFKQFTGGGPNSMRAWTVRSLNSYSTRTQSTRQKEFYGDIMAEANAEFRFLVRNVMGIPIKSALFLDMGNIWNWKPYDKSLVPQNMGTIEKIANDVAIAGGTSIRLDFEYFLIRLDFGLKLKTPKDIYGNGGLFDKNSLNFKRDGLRPIKMQVGINYPF